jgi:hypothetical protein
MASSESYRKFSFLHCLVNQFAIAPSSRWDRQHWCELVSLLTGVSEYLQLYRPPVASVAFPTGITGSLATLASRVLAGELPASEPFSTACSKQLVACLSYLLKFAYKQYDEHAQPISLSASDALSLAQQLTLCPVLAAAAGAAE